MIGNSPLDGYLVETGLVIASTDALAADVVRSLFTGINIQAVAASVGSRALVGESRLDRISLKDAMVAFT